MNPIEDTKYWDVPSPIQLHQPPPPNPEPQVDMNNPSMPPGFELLKPIPENTIQPGDMWFDGMVDGKGWTPAGIVDIGKKVSIYTHIKWIRPTIIVTEPAPKKVWLNPWD